MIDNTDDATLPLPLDGQDAAQDTAPASDEGAAKRKYSPRAKYTDAQALKFTAGRDPESPSVMLFTALRGLGIAHKVIDDVFDAPDNTTINYLKTATEQVDESTGVVFGDTQALQAFDMLYALVSNGALSGNTLQMAGVLKAMRNFQRLDAPLS